MLSSEPPLARAEANTAENAALAWVGLPLMATWFLYSGFSRSANEVGGVFTLSALYPIAT